MALVAIFFVSGADAASIVMGSLSERGTTEPRRPVVVFWGVATGAVAAVMLLAGGTDALEGLQTITIVAALPFVVIMIGLAASLMKDLREDPLMVRKRYGEEAIEQAVIAGVTEHGDDFALSVESVEPEPAPGEPEPGRARPGPLLACRGARSTHRNPVGGPRSCAFLGGSDHGEQTRAGRTPPPRPPGRRRA
ncbi:BCCT family transporter [Nocardioides convexus]|uniref:BCCT family transporter n=1 Tax=Nocardioides convexus TaxID=2712224 RepID=UPI0024189B4F|nr:BCCT family transporter [Nocardioides convexus]